MVSVGSYAFAYCSSLKVVVILPTTISIDSDAFYGDSALTRLNATQEICMQVQNSCGGTCMQFRQCLSSPPSPTSSAPSGLSAGVIAAIVICSIAGAVAIGLLLWWKHYLRTQSTVDYNAVRATEMPPAISEQPKDDTSTIEARALPQGELLVTLDQVSPYPEAAAVVV